MHNLQIASTSIRQSNGLYSLNDLHKGSGEEKRHRPNYFLAIDQTKELIAEISKAGIPALQTYKGNRSDGLRGTYACKLLAGGNIQIKHFCVIVKAHWPKPSVGIDLPYMFKVPKHLHSLSAFFVPALWRAAWEHLRVRRFLERGKVNPVQPATLSLTSECGGFNNLLFKEASHV